MQTTQQRLRNTCRGPHSSQASWLRTGPCLAATPPSPFTTRRPQGCARPRRGACPHKIHRKRVLPRTIHCLAGGRSGDWRGTGAPAAPRPSFGVRRVAYGAGRSTGGLSCVPRGWGRGRVPSRRGRSGISPEPWGFARREAWGPGDLGARSSLASGAGARAQRGPRLWAHGRSTWQRALSSPARVPPSASLSGPLSGPPSVAG